ncbi:hypothetical protein PI124_g18211 [Phytophthora idaei]|nr:hypothetical protein PI125_g18843 [Phytophthora idaei]KAG3136203.1 hypothetical protein PI126_g17915 [Phytophthora idaei]KAG3236785.1 hypothetical protein PI124_g18211 [Phytophthora idaei]
MNNQASENPVPQVAPSDSASASSSPAQSGPGHAAAVSSGPVAFGSATTDADAANPVADQSEDNSSDSREDVRLVPSLIESPASEEGGSSGDESFEPDSEGADSDMESLTAESAASSEQDEEEDISNYLIDGLV